jgi:hypothetical protein
LPPSIVADRETRRRLALRRRKAGEKSARRRESGASETPLSPVVKIPGVIAPPGPVPMPWKRLYETRSGAVEHRLQGFCTEEEYQEFLRSCPLFEEMLARSGIILVKYWFSVNDEEQEKRLQDRMRNPTKR